MDRSYLGFEDETLDSSIDGVCGWMETCLRVFICDWRTCLKRIWTEGREVMTSDRRCFLEERNSMYTMVAGEQKDDSESQFEQIRVQFF